jgi:hypothetical protein
MQGAQSTGLRKFLPGDWPRTRLTPSGELQALTAKALHGGPGGAGTLEGVEKHMQALPDLLIRFQDHPLVLIINQPDRQGQLQLGPLGFVARPLTK